MDALPAELFASIRRIAMTIGAVVVSHNSADDLPACIEALRGAAALERVVVVDNASRDQSRELVRGFNDPRIRLVAEEINSGFAGGCNRGFREFGSAFEHLVFLNPDVVVSEDCLQRAANALAQDDTLAGVAPLLMRSDGESVDTCGQVLKPWSLEVSDRGYGEPLTAELEQRVDVLAACGALAVFRQQALASVADKPGPWAQHYFCFWEDLELGWRLVNSGWRIQSCPEAVATHRRGAGAVSGRGPLRWRRPPELEACILTNRWMTLIRHLHPLDLVVRLPLLLLWDTGLVAAGAVRRPSLIGHLRRRWPMVMCEWRNRSRDRRRRLHELP
jgi:GT2 family glycosyltransferase